jgi:phospholipase D
MALSLALVGTPLTLPAASVASSAAIAVCFSPEEDCAGFAVRAIDNAGSEILISAYGLTTGTGIVEALARAKKRGLDVRLIGDKTTPCGRNSGVPLLANAGVPIWIDDQARIAHEKAMVIDEAAVLTGSYNWTRRAAENSEDLNLISSSTVAAAYAAHWHKRLALSVRFAACIGPESGTDRLADYARWWCLLRRNVQMPSDGSLGNFARGHYLEPLVEAPNGKG